MSLNKNNLICKCFMTDNYFVKSLKLHTRYYGPEDFISSNRTVLENSSLENVDGILKELQDELNRRTGLGEESKRRRDIIKNHYVPLHPHIYKLQEQFLVPEFREMVSQCKAAASLPSGLPIGLQALKGTDRVYQFPVFTSQFCREFVEELTHFENSDMPKGRPNTMNLYGVNIEELGFDDQFLTPFRERYLSPIAGVLYADCGGTTLDSHRAFTVSYGPSADDDLDLHFDNGEVTVNISLSADESSDSGGDLYFGGMRTDRTPVGVKPPTFARCRHRVGQGLFHRGQQLHGALPLSRGSSRHNLIIWMRSSKERNRMCPMCDRPPELVETVGNGDGFSVPVVDVCRVV